MINRYLFLPAITLVLLTGSCKKFGNPESEVVIDYPGKERTCPENTDCKFSYTENADLTGDFPLPKLGQYRLFAKESKNSYSTETIYIKAPMEGDSFNYTKADILEGNVKLAFSCASCDFVIRKPVDGWVKGQKANPDKYGKDAWLIEAIITVQAEGNPAAAKENIQFSQIFNKSLVSP